MFYKKLLTTIFFWVILSFVLQGCSLFKQPDYFPLTKGSQWIYSYQDIDVIYEVIGNEELDGKMCTVIETIVNKQSSQKLYFIKTKKELLEVAKLTTQTVRTKYKPPQPLMKFPVKVGDEWNWDGSLDNNNKANINIRVTKKEKVSTPAGFFDTIKIETVGTVNTTIGVKMEMWFAPNVGLVKEIFQYGPSKVSLLLKSYKIAK